MVSSAGEWFFWYSGEAGRFKKPKYIDALKFPVAYPPSTPVRPRADLQLRGKQKWRVGDLLADERCSPAVLDFLRSTHVKRTAPPVEENWDSEEEAKGEGGGANGVVTRALLVLDSFLYVFFLSFQMCTFLGAGFSCFHTFYLLGALTVRSICRRRGRGCCHRAGPSGRDGRQELDKIVCRHSL